MKSSPGVGGGERPIGNSVLGSRLKRPPMDRRGALGVTWECEPRLERPVRGGAWMASAPCVQEEQAKDERWDGPLSSTANRVNP